VRIIVGEKYRRDRSDLPVESLARGGGMNAAQYAIYLSTEITSELGYRLMGPLHAMPDRTDQATRAGLGIRCGRDLESPSDLFQEHEILFDQVAQLHQRFGGIVVQVECLAGD